MADVAEAYVREAFAGAAALLAEVPACGRSAQRSARPGLEPHAHPDAFEICLLTRGEVDWWASDQVFTLRAGQVSVTHPGESHGGIGSIVHPCELYWFQVGAGTGPADDGQLDAIRRDLASVAVRALDASGDLQRAIRTLVDEHREPGRHAELAARAALHAALVLLTREARAASAPEVSEPVRKALAWMADRVGEAYGVGDVAAAVGLSTVRLQARFRREVNCSIGEHRNRLRLHAAKRLLRATDLPVTDLAHRLGFASSQYFATFFRRYAGASPTDYRTRADEQSASVGS